ncbi:MAG: hypothetical protein DRP62_00585 [Planctomycetota bacterium]|nr:MAG: hypothetical protein DRP62_00585 [Planctomycetota bacterium]
MKMVKAVVFFCAAVVLAVPCVMDATPLGTVDIAHTGFGAVSTVRIWGGGYTGRRVLAGAYMFNKTGSTGEGNHWANGSVGTFCIDLPESPSSSTLTYDVAMPEDGPVPTGFLGGPMGAKKAEYLSELWGRFYDSSWVSGNSVSEIERINDKKKRKGFTKQQKHDAAAFAVAIWEIVYEDLPESPLKWDVKNDGTEGKLGFRCDGSITDTANKWLHSLDGTGTKSNLRSWLYDGKQDYIVAKAPEPSTAVMLGLTSLVALPRKRHK